VHVRLRDLTPVVVAAVCCLALCACTPAKKDGKAEEGIGPGGNDLLALVLKTGFKAQGYTIVSPQTRLGMGETKDAAEIEASKKYIREGLKAEGYDFTKLIDALYACNSPSVKLTLPSAPDDGYVVDYDGKFSKYFEGEGGGWEALRKENPLAAGMTTVSLPVLDKKNGIVLVYVGTQYDWTAGSGSVFAFRLEKGALREIGSVMMWIS